MNHFKENKNKLEKLRGIFFQLGLIIAGGLTLLAFEWTTPTYAYEFPTPYEEYEEEDIDIIYLPEKKKVEKPKVTTEPKKVDPNKLEIVPDEKEVKEEKKVEKKKEKKKEGKKKKKKEEKETLDYSPQKWPHHVDCESLEKEEERKKCTQEKMFEHFKNEIHIPNEIKHREKKSYKVYVYFEINKRGKIDKVKILNKSDKKIPKELKRQAFNAVQSLPVMIPGNNSNGKNVSVPYTVPILFSIR